MSAMAVTTASDELEEEDDEVELDVEVVVFDGWEFEFEFDGLGLLPPSPGRSTGGVIPGTGTPPRIAADMISSRSRTREAVSYPMRYRPLQSLLV